MWTVSNYQSSIILLAIISLDSLYLIFFFVITVTIVSFNELLFIDNWISFSFVILEICWCDCKILIFNIWLRRVMISFDIVFWLLFDIHISHVFFYYSLILTTFCVFDDIWVTFLRILMLKYATFWDKLTILMTLLDDLSVFLALEFTC